MSDIQKAIDFAKKNPDDPRSMELRRRMESGQLNSELQEAGLRTFTVAQPRAPLQEIDVSGTIAGVQQVPVEEVQTKRPVTDVEIAEAKQKLSAEDIRRDVAKAGRELVTDFTERGQNVIDIFKSDQDPFSKALQLVGQVAGGAVDVAERGIQAAVTAVLPEKFEAAAVKKLQSLLETEGGKKAAEAISAGLDKWNEFKLSNPKFASNIESILPIAELLTIGFGAPIVARATGEAIETAAKATEKVIGVAKPIVKEAVEVAEETVETAIKKIDAFRTAKAERKEIIELENIAEQIQEPLNKKDRIDLLKITGEERGAVKKGFLAEVKPKPTKVDLERAEAVKGLVDKDPLTSIANINEEIARIAKEDIRPHLQANPRAFNTATINARINALEKPLIFKTEKSLEVTYELVREKMIETIAKHPKTMEGLYDARIEFDKVVKQEFGDVAFGDPKRSVVRRAIQDIRREVNEFIGTEIGDDVLKTSLRKQHLMFEAAENIAEANNNIFGSTRFSRWAERNPKLAKTIKWGTILGIGGISGQLIF